MKDITTINRTYCLGKPPKSWEKVEVEHLFTCYTLRATKVFSLSQIQPFPICFLFIVVQSTQNFEDLQKPEVIINRREKPLNIRLSSIILLSTSHLTFPFKKVSQTTSRAGYAVCGNIQSSRISKSCIFN